MLREKMNVALINGSIFFLFAVIAPSIGAAITGNILGYAIFAPLVFTLSLCCYGYKEESVKLYWQPIAMATLDTTIVVAGLQLCGVNFQAWIYDMLYYGAAPKIKDQWIIMRLLIPLTIAVLSYMDAKRLTEDEGKTINYRYEVMITSVLGKLLLINILLQSDLLEHRYFIDARSVYSWVVWALALVCNIAYNIYLGINLKYKANNYTKVASANGNKAVASANGNKAYFKFTGFGVDLMLFFLLLAMQICFTYMPNKAVQHISGIALVIIIVLRHGLKNPTESKSGHGILTCFPILPIIIFINSFDHELYAGPSLGLMIWAAYVLGSRLSSEIDKEQAMEGGNKLDKSDIFLDAVFVILWLALIFWRFTGWAWVDVDETLHAAKNANLFLSWASFVIISIYLIAHFTLNLIGGNCFPQDYKKKLDPLFTIAHVVAIAVISISFICAILVAFQIA